MINSGTNLNEEANVKHGNEKQTFAGTKKTALRDVQNQENLTYFGGKTAADVIKGCGTKRLAPDYPSTTLVNNGVNEHILNARIRLDLELGPRRFNNNVNRFSDCPQSQQSCQLQRGISHRKTDVRETGSSQIPIGTSSNKTLPQPFSISVPAAVSNLLGHSSNKIQAKTTDEQQRAERFIRLQKFLKKCDDSYQKDYVQMLLRLSPAGLSRHAVELEKRAIQIAMEEGKEIQQMKVLNMLAHSAPADKPLQTTQLNKSKN